MYGLPAQGGPGGLNAWEDPRRTLGLPGSAAPPRALAALLFGGAAALPATLAPELRLDPYGDADAHGADAFENALSFFRLHSAPRGALLLRAQRPFGVPLHGRHAAGGAAGALLGDKRSTYILLHGRVRLLTQHATATTGAGRRAWGRLYRAIMTLAAFRKGALNALLLSALESARAEREGGGRAAGKGGAAAAAAAALAAKASPIGRGRRGGGGASGGGGGGGSSGDEDEEDEDGGDGSGGGGGGKKRSKKAAAALPSALGMALGATSGDVLHGDVGSWVEVNAVAGPVVLGAHATVLGAPHWATASCAEPSILLELRPQAFARLCRAMPAAALGLAALASLHEPAALVACVPCLAAALADGAAHNAAAPRGPAGSDHLPLVCSLAALFRPVVLSVGE